MQAMLAKHREWKIKRLLALLMRHLWDLLPHGRTVAKNGDPIPVCPICRTDIDDVHHILVECQHPMLKSLRITAVRQAFQIFRKIPRISQTAIDYAQTLTRLLLIPNPQRLSHAIWYGRPFMATLTAADALMP